jgi:hypothetical protein
MITQLLEKTNDGLFVSLKKDVVIYDEYRINRNKVIRYISICTPCFDSAKIYGNVYSAIIILNEDGIDTETKFIYDIARDEDDAYRIMKLLSANGVTPDTASDVIYDILE